MTQPDIHDDGFRVTELGAFRWRVDPMHEVESVRAIRRRWKRESGMVGGKDWSMSGWRAADEFWAITFPGSHGEEIGIEPYDCSEPWDCHCLRMEREGGPRRRCGISLAEARQEVVKHYCDKAAYLDGLPLPEFAQWMGYCDDDASADTHPKDGDVQQAPLVSGAVPDRADARKPHP